MQKKLCLIIMVLLAVGAQAGIYNFKVTATGKNEKIKMYFKESGEMRQVSLQNGEGCLNLDNFSPQYVSVKCGTRKFPLYLDSKKDLTISFDAKDLNGKITFSGPGHAENEYLNEVTYSKVNFKASYGSEQAFLNKCDSVYSLNLSYLEQKKGLSKEFIEKEKENINYVSYSIMGVFPLHRRSKGYSVPSENFYKKLEQKCVYDDKFLIYPDYKSLIFFGTRELVLHQSKDLDAGFIKYVSAHVKAPLVREYIVDRYVFMRVSNEGIEGAEPLLAFYKENVKNKDYIARVEEKCARWRRITQGNPAPDFAYPDIDGKIVKLSDLKGKYVYIDVWATWCAPCRRELPYLKRLEETYRGKDIVFVSMSCDQNKKAWEKMVREQNLKGIQLHIGSNSQFSKDYALQGIPRFILLDKNGSVVDNDALRPSDAKINSLLNELLAK